MKKTQITLQPAVHQGMAVLQIIFPYHLNVVERLKLLPGFRWSKTMRCWYVGGSASVAGHIIDLVGDMAVVDCSGIETEISPDKNLAPAKAEVHTLGTLSEESIRGLEKLKTWMLSRRYSDNTISTYIDALRTFLRFFAHKALEDIDHEDVVTFNNAYILKNQLSASYQNQVVNAVKLYFTVVLQKRMDLQLIHRPKRAKVLPNVLSKEEVKLVLGALHNIKHKTMLSLIYSAGLRCGEMIQLKPQDIDISRGLIVIRQAKGKKDRIVPLSLKVRDMIAEYLLAFKPMHYLFEGQKAGQAYDNRSLQQVLHLAVKKAGIKKPVTLHWLRHSYATHLLENGTDLRYIQEILGHKSSKTTEIYTHVSMQSIQRITSPFDSL